MWCDNRHGAVESEINCIGGQISTLVWTLCERRNIHFTSCKWYVESEINYKNGQISTFNFDLYENHAILISHTLNLSVAYSGTCSSRRRRAPWSRCSRPGWSSPHCCSASRPVTSRSPLERERQKLSMVYDNIFWFMENRRKVETAIFLYKNYWTCFLLLQILKELKQK